MKKTCKGCRFWEDEVVNTDIIQLPDADPGECRLKAPSIDGKWPPVRQYQWCGEWKEKEGETSKLHEAKEGLKASIDLMHLVADQILEWWDPINYERPPSFIATAQGIKKGVPEIRDDWEEIGDEPQ